jgi:hydroxymethylpyrimidine pyrophosphatase-like HAD family hydrolase
MGAGFRGAYVEFITGYSISKKPIASEIYRAVGERMKELYGVDTKFFQEKITQSAENIQKTIEKAAENVKQTQYFLTLPSDCVQKLKGFVKTKAFKSNKTEAIAEKIEAMNEQRFLENLFQIIL